MNTLALAALKRIGDVLRHHKAEIHFADKVHELSDGNKFIEHAYGVHISKNEYHDINAYIGTQIKHITEEELCLRFIKQETMGTGLPAPEVLAFLEDLHSVFKDLNIRWERHAPFTLRINGTRQLGIGYYLKYEDTVQLRAKIADKAVEAQDGIFEMAAFLKKHDAHISWRYSEWPAGGHGGSVYPTPIWHAVLHVGEASHEILTGGDPLPSDWNFQYALKEAPRPINRIFTDFSSLMRKHNISITCDNDLYKDDILIDRIMNITPYYLYDLAQHIED